jgi:hypothetical protein
MTAVERVEVDDNIKDFSAPPKKIQFRITPDVFDCVTDLPVLSLIDFAVLVDQVDTNSLSDHAKDLFIDMFNLVLLDTSAERFVERMRDKNNPISMTQVQEILPWVMEQYGMRPTQPSDNSSDGSPTQESGQNSTESAPAVVSTSELSPFLASST